MCRDWLAQLEQHRVKLEAEGLQVIAVGVGSPGHAAKVCGKLAPGLTCYTDAEGVPHRLYGAGRGKVLDALKPQQWANIARAASHGQMQGTATGDVAILGATFIVDRAGIIRYAHYDRIAGDNAPLEEILGAARGA
jgi:peroxiredoxin